MPLPMYEHCVKEKYDWVAQHLGKEWTMRINLMNDKTLIRGDLLIDDKPKITGLLTPEWQHIIYDAPYNRGVPGPRMTWDDMSVIDQCLRD
jgi:5'-nucleotidase